MKQRRLDVLKRNRDKSGSTSPQQGSGGLSEEESLSSMFTTKTEFDTEGEALLGSVILDIPETREDIGRNRSEPVSQVAVLLLESGRISFRSVNTGKSLLEFDVKDRL